MLTRWALRSRAGAARRRRSRARAPRACRRCVMSSGPASQTMSPAATSSTSLVLESARHPQMGARRARRAAGDLPLALVAAGRGDVEPARRGAAQLVAHAQAALQHAAAADAADVVAPGQRADLHEEGRLLVDLRRRHVATIVSKRSFMPASASSARIWSTARRRLRADAPRGRLFALVLVEVVDDPALEARAVQDGKVELFVAGPQLDEEVEGLVEGARGVGVGPVGLVHDDDRPQPSLSARMST